jgi:hypothetical protein
VNALTANGFYEVSGSKAKAPQAVSLPARFQPVRKAKKDHPRAARVSEDEVLGIKQGDGRPARWNTSFRFALKSRASLQDVLQRIATHENEQYTRGTTKKGTFLNR